MAVSKEQLADVLVDSHTLTLEAWAALLDGCSMSDMFKFIEQIEDKMKFLRELTVKHSKELAAHISGVPGRRLNGKPDKRFKAAKRV